MKRENFKTLFLAILIIITAYLSISLWKKTIDDSSKEYNQELIIEDEKSYKLSDVIIPQKTVIRLNENDRTVIYSGDKYDIWTKGKEALKTIFNGKDMDKDIVELEEYEKQSQNKSVEFYFTEDLYTHMLGKILEIDIPKSIYKKIDKISSIKFSVGENSFFILSNNNNEKIIIKTQMEKLSSLKVIVSQIEQSDYTKYYKLEEVIGVKSDLYIPVNSKSSIPTVRINTKYNINKDRKLDDSIAEIFFYKKLEYIRKIEEGSGASIYIDGENVLKIYTDGRLEYIGNMEENNDSDLYSSIKKSVDFVSAHRGWPENVYLSNIESVNIDEKTKGYRFIFRYKLNGLTVFSDKEDIQDKIEVEVINGSVTSYKSRIWNNLGISIRDSETNNISAFEIIDKNFLFLKEQYIKRSKQDNKSIRDEQLAEKVKGSINDIYLAYYGYLNGEQEILKPAWVIELLGERYIFDAYSGDLKS